MTTNVDDAEHMILVPKSLLERVYGASVGLDDLRKIEALLSMPSAHEQIFDAINGQWFDDDWDTQINLGVTTAGQITTSVLAVLAPQS